MGRKPNPANTPVKHRVTTHLDDEKYRELKKILDRTHRLGMSALIRNILADKPIKVFVRDATRDKWIDELSKLRSEIKAIGVNINQITRHFNSYPDAVRKGIYAKMAFDQYERLNPSMNRILFIIEKMGEKWLQS